MRRLWRQRRAAVAVMFALTIIPLLGFVALAFDVGSAVWARSQLDLAADAAALSGVMTGANDFAANSTTSFQPAQLAGQKRFYAQAGALPSVSITSLSVLVTRSGGTITSTVSYAAQYTTTFAGLFGIATLPASGTSTISRTNSPFFALDFLVDTSSSMAIGASQSDMDQLGILVHASPWYASWGQSQNCAFGCHFDAGYNDFYGMAHSHGLSLRLDVLKTAVENVIATISASPQAAQFTVGVYQFNSAASTVYADSGNMTAASLAVQNLQLPLTTAGNDADTNINAALQSMASTLPAGGDGSTSSLPRRFLFIVTDGVQDYYSGSTRVMAAFDPTKCAPLTTNNIQILTLYTQYIPIDPPYVPTANAFYDSNIKKFVGNIFPNLQACASSANFAFQATDGASINTALQAMLQAALSAPARFTQ